MFFNACLLLPSKNKEYIKIIVCSYYINDIVSLQMSKSDDDVDDDWESLEEQIDHFISSTEKTTSRAYETEQWQSIEKGRANISS